ncbi:hypothetical protein [Desulfosarcina cetonica]|uniref:hypothetical protein n=1 Tax=Desulfosarcina cetonica TaxID=90730 RepID=UPI0012ED55A1|nr:hypothetical protein [Desulfosarcina cetonica]
MKTCSYIIPAVETIDSLRDRLHQAFSSVNETVETETLEAFDTFDWRLYHKVGS